MKGGARTISVADERRQKRGGETWGRKESRETRLTTGEERKEERKRSESPVVSSPLILCL